MASMPQKEGQETRNEKIAGRPDLQITLEDGFPLLPPPPNFEHSKDDLELIIRTFLNKHYCEFTTSISEPIINLRRQLLHRHMYVV